MKAIFNHFNSLGGLYNVSQENLLDTRIFNDEIKLIEEYLKRDIPKLLWNILKNQFDNRVFTQLSTPNRYFSI